MHVLTLKNVSKSFGDFYAVRELSFYIEEGSVYGLLGPNGAGKTTTIRMIMDIIVPDEGKITILGQKNSPEVRDKVGYLPEERGLYRKMKVFDLLTFFAELKGVKRDRSGQKINYWLERFDLAEWSHKKVEELSRGMQQKLQFITTVLHEPKLIILDEPFAGLDPVNTDLVKEVMLEQKNSGASIIFSTHMMEQVEMLCDSICLINEGKKVLEGDLKKVKRDFGRNTIVLEYEGQAHFLKDPKLVSKYDDHGNYVEIKLADNVDAQALLQEAMKEVNVSRFEIMEPSLREIFIATVKN